MYETINQIFKSVFTEIQGLAKKKPEATLNKIKVEQLNKILIDARLIFEGSPQVKYLDLLDDETLPQFSDALMVLAQYDGALKTFHDNHWKYRDRKHQWVE